MRAYHERLFGVHLGCLLGVPPASSSEYDGLNPRLGRTADGFGRFSFVVAIGCYPALAPRRAGKCPNRPFFLPGRIQLIGVRSQRG